MTNVDIGKLYGACRKFLTVWDDPYSEPAAFGPAVAEMREVLKPQAPEDVVEQAARVLDYEEGSEWPEDSDRGRELAQALDDAGLLRARDSETLTVRRSGLHEAIRDGLDRGLRDFGFVGVDASALTGHVIRELHALTQEDR